MDQEILQALNEIRTELREIKGYVLDLRTRTRQSNKVLLSLRAAAARLGIDRNTTVHELMARKQIRTVKANGRIRIPASEIERVAREGFSVFTQKRRTPVRKFGANPGAAIRALKT